MKHQGMKYHWLFCGLMVAGAVIVTAVYSGQNNPSVKADPSQTAALAEKIQSQISVRNDYYDFGTINMKNGLVRQVYKLTNLGQQPIIISKAYTSCMCTKANIISQNGKTSGPFGMPGHGGAVARANVTIQPGEGFSVEAVFDPAAHGPSGIGLANRMIYLETNSEVSPKVELKFSANVTN